ncbi:hypothetical protein ACQV2T_06680 [Facklamia sp. P13069]|uniref:hypothetical protein n=1 Tax=Facklamia sp. P13069 TaxID=3421954 RepID=UPI003D1806BC
MFEWLESFKEIKNKIEFYQFQLEESKAELKRWVDGDLQKIKLESESLSSNLEENIKRYTKELEILKDRRDKLTNLIKGFEDLDSQILVMKYIEKKSLFEISEDLGYSYQHIREKHSRLVQAIKLADKISMDDLSEI